MWPFERLTPTGRVLSRARRMIERQGWTQGRVGGVSGSGPCAAHAIVLAARKEPYEEVMAAFAEHNALPYPRPGYNPTQRTTSWNDKLGRTREEVIAAFRTAEATETERWSWAAGGFARPEDQPAAAGHEARSAE